jgi:hypothetical protein
VRKLQGLYRKWTINDQGNWQLAWFARFGNHDQFLRYVDAKEA